MNKIIFYSWQSDLPNKTNRGFIQIALEKAVASISADDSFDIQPVIERDTEGVPGSPDIATTIFKKISSANIFVADVSIIIKKQGNFKATPNPNVLIELGFAIKALGFERIILIFNKSFGNIDDLPFDLKTRRLTLYEASDAVADKSIERKELQKKLEEAIRSAITYDNNVPKENNNLDLRNVNAIRIGSSKGTFNMLGQRIKDN